MKNISIHDENPNNKRKSIPNIIKNTYNLRYNLIDLNKESKKYKSFGKYKTILRMKVDVDKRKTINSEKRKELIKKEKIIYLLRKLYIILPDDMKKNNLISKKLNFELYFPIEYKTKRNLDFLDKGQNNDIICKNLSDLILEVYKYLKITLYDKIKLEIFDDKFLPIKLESQLYNNKKRIIYAKITYITQKKINSWKKRLIMNMHPFNIKHNLIKSTYKYSNISTEIKQEQLNYFNKNRCETEKSNSLKNNNEIQAFNKDSSKDLDVVARYNTTDATLKNDKVQGKFKLNLPEKKLQNITINTDRKSVNLSTSNDNINNNLELQDNVEESNKIFLRTSDKTFKNLENKRENNKNNSIIKTHKLKIKKNFFSDLNKIKFYEHNTLISPLLFDFDTTDIINLDKIIIRKC